jgi:acetyltransferase-like isoleucine patch superfamily enzyme
MIKLGKFSVSLYPNSGILWENHGGEVVFRGSCTIGNASAVSVGKFGHIVFGNNFIATAAFKLTSYCSITFDENVLIAWDVIVMDTSFHKLKRLDGNVKDKPFAPIHIGKNNWLTSRVLVLKGTKTSDFTVIGAGSILNKDFSHYPMYALLAGNPVKLKAEGIMLDSEDHRIEYQFL